MWLLAFVVCGAVVLLGPVWREISEHITRGDLPEAVVFFPFILTLVNHTPYVILPREKNGRMT